MAAPSTIHAPVGFRNCQIFALDTNCYPAAPGTTAYEGVQISGANTLTITDPEPRIITHLGDDVVLSLDALPAAEGMRANLVVSKINDVADALLTGTKNISQGADFSLFGEKTDQEGNWPNIGIIAYQQSQDADPDSLTFKKRLWAIRIFPQAMIVPLAASMDANPLSKTYLVVPSMVTKHIWGTAFTLATEGFTKATTLRGIGNYKPKLAIFKAIAAQVAFPFPVATPALNAAGIKVWVNGVEQTTGVTSATTGLTFSVAPGTDAMVVSLRGL